MRWMAGRLNFGAHLRAGSANLGSVVEKLTFFVELHDCFVDCAIILSPVPCCVPDCCSVQVTMKDLSSSASNGAKRKQANKRKRRHKRRNCFHSAHLNALLFCVGTVLQFVTFFMLLNDNMKLRGALGCQSIRNNETASALKSETPVETPVEPQVDDPQSEQILSFIGLRTRWTHEDAALKSADEPEKIV